MSNTKKNKSNLRNKNKIPVAKQTMPRSKEKYPALNSKRAVKTRQDQLEVPYLDQLNDEEKAFLNSFLEETVITNFNHKGKRLFKDAKPFYNANNARNKCMYTAAKALGILESRTLEELGNLVKNPTTNNEEDAMLEAMELKRSGKWQDEELSPEERAHLIKIGALKKD